MRYDPYLAAICPWPTPASLAGQYRGAYRRAWMEGKYENR